MNGLGIPTCVEAVKEAMGFGAKALTVEASVALALFTGGEGAASNLKEAVIGVYHKAGYDCHDSKGRHYKTVNRRVNAFAGLYAKLGGKKIRGWVGEANEKDMLAHIGKEVDKLGFRYMDDVLDYVGKTSNRGRPKGSTKDKGAAEAPAYHVAVGGLVVDLPREVDPVVVIKLAQKLMALAAQLGAENAMAKAKKGRVRTPAPKPANTRVKRAAKGVEAAKLH